MEGFPPVDKQVQIVNKLNEMVVTVSQGWHNTQAGSAIVERPTFPKTQTFKFVQKDKSDVFIIEHLFSDVVLSPKSSWGDMVYSELKFSKYTKQASQLWRIVPYDTAIYNEKNQPKHIFQYVPVLTNLNSGNSHEHKLSSASNKQPFLKLGYEFDSGSHLDYAYEEQKYRQNVMSCLDRNGERVGGNQRISQESQISTPVRFPVKQKSNLQLWDKNNKGWFFIQNVRFNLVLQIQGGINEPGMGIVLNTLYGNRNQLWKFV